MVLLCPAAAAEGALATLSWHGDGKLSLRYELPERGPNRLVFANNAERTHAVVRSRFWKIDPACFAIDPRGLELVGGRNCANREILLDWDEQERDRVYPGIVRLRNGGALVFAAYLQVLNSEGNAIAPIRVVAPTGGVVAFRSMKSSTELIIDGANFEKDGRGWLYFGPDVFEEVGAGRIFIDDGVPTALRDELLHVQPRLMQIFERELGLPYSARVTIYVTWGDRDRDGTSWQADVVPGEVRFTVSGKGWGNPSAENMETFRHSAAHELAHLWNAGIFQPAEWAAPWMAEGSAELLSIAALLKAGIWKPPAATEKITSATSECLVLAGSRAWVAMRERNGGRAPYACGLAIQFAIVAAAQRCVPMLDSFGFWRGLWKGYPTYYEAAFIKHARDLGCEALAIELQATLTRADMPLDPALRSLYALAGIPLQTGIAVPNEVSKAAGDRVMAALMSADCNGAYGFWTQADHYYVDKVACRSFKPSMRVAFVEGRNLMTDTIAAVAAAKAACAEAKGISLKTLEGNEFTVACTDEAAKLLPSSLGGYRLSEADAKRVLTGSR